MPLPSANATTYATDLPSFTERLLYSHPESFLQATRSPFLSAAGQGLVPSSVLSGWLSQDRLYGQAYVNFIGSLLGLVRLPVSLDRERQSLQWRITDMLTAALENIHREWKFYIDVAERYGLRADVPEVDGEEFAANETTKGYVELFQSFQDPGRSLLEGMVVLWGTEKCYLEAWSYALAEGSGTAGPGDMDGGALRKEFIPNWTSEEFVGFVGQIARLTDELARESDMETESGRCGNVWRKVLELEKAFWPSL